MNDISQLNGVFRLDAYPALAHTTAEGRGGTALIDVPDEVAVVDISDAGSALADAAEDVSMISNDRLQKLARIKAEIDSGVYETRARLNVVVDRLIELL